MVGFLEKSRSLAWNLATLVGWKTGKVKPFGQKDDGADLVESAFLIQGLLAVREYYKSGTVEEKILANRIDCALARDGLGFSYQRWSKNTLLALVPKFCLGYEFFALEGYNETLNHLCFGSLLTYSSYFSRSIPSRLG